MRGRARLALAAVALALTAQATPQAAAPAPVKLWRLDCGTIYANRLNLFSDTMSYDGRSKTITDSCYLIAHGTDYLLVDTGLPTAVLGAPNDPAQPIAASLRVSVVDQLRRIGVAPAQIGRVAITHYHFDHIGQAASFPGATLLIGAADWASVRATPAPFGFEPALLQPWLQGGGKVDPVSGDRDVFGDGSVTLLALPGHTPGHQGVLVRLRSRTLLLTGDAAHFRENYDRDGVPTFNTDRAASLASLDRVKRLAAAQHAEVIIDHEPADVAKLPAFPAAAQ